MGLKSCTVSTCYSCDEIVRAVVLSCTEDTVSLRSYPTFNSNNLYTPLSMHTMLFNTKDIRFYWFWNLQPTPHGYEGTAFLLWCSFHGFVFPVSLTSRVPYFLRSLTHEDYFLSFQWDNGRVITYNYMISTSKLGLAYKHTEVYLPLLLPFKSILYFTFMKKKITQWQYRKDVKEGNSLQNHNERWFKCQT